ncbi:Zn-dependent hydrolase YycJ/WalJ, required for cell wall metabolism and coordination of cell division with DNA replication [Olavius sp. associated proteobacterium Delta 1]|nr:Zn-dependent hydrolase YycJ/WalJ, required for cell wall metabolism and coordination of cell division with DNA replication [Olavius sp. associated proteobacterium Delta 1]
MMTISKKSDNPSDYNLAVCNLASGSKGNATFISDGKTSILIDAGLSGIELQRRLISRNLEPEGLDAILVTHEHSDHVKGAGILSRRFKLPVYINQKTEAASPGLGSPHEIRPFDCGTTFKIDNLTIHPFSISHDAEDPAGFTIGRNGTSMAIATDLGIATAMVKEHLKHCALLVLEANHDPQMLETGPYPWPLKQRIQSRVGHLSNSDSKNLLHELQHDNLQHVILAHLSEINNTPQKAFDEVVQALTRCNAQLTVADQYSSGPVIYLK